MAGDYKKSTANMRKSLFDYSIGYEASLLSWPTLRQSSVMDIFCSDS